MSRQPKWHQFEPKGLIPNNSSLPMAVWRQVLPELGLASAPNVRFKLRDNGWGGAWVNGIYPFHHYHARSHEVLVIVAGSAEVVLGGPGGLTTTLEAGDVVVLPAGTGHCRVSGSSDLSVVGAYPRGQEDYDLKRESEQECAAAQREIPEVPLPASDPLFGPDGPLMRSWRSGS